MMDMDKKIIDMLTKEQENRQPIKSIVEELEDIDNVDDYLFDVDDF